MTPTFTVTRNPDPAKRARLAALVAKYAQTVPAPARERQPDAKRAS